MDSDKFEFLEKSDFGLASSFKYFSSKLEGEIAPKEFDNFKFAYAPIKDPSTFGDQIKASEGREKEIMDHLKGTTTLAFEFQGGIIVAVDSRASIGSFVGSDSVRKILEINDYLLGTMAGGAADCQFWERVLGMECRLYELRNGQKPSVATASRILGNIVYRYRGYGLSMGTMVAGWDPVLDSPQLYYIDDDGTRVKGKLFSVGSGSPYAYGVLDSQYKYDMTKEQAIELGMKQ
jgi:20S proteasome, alpha and beta subunits